MYSAEIEKNTIQQDTTIYLFHKQKKNKTYILSNFKQDNNIDVNKHSSLSIAFSLSLLCDQKMKTHTLSYTTLNVIIGNLGGSLDFFR